jgi:hypothetical protein
MIDDSSLHTPRLCACLEKALVFALEVALEDDAANLRAPFAERLLCAEVGAIEGRVMRQLTGPADAGAERLVTSIAAAAPVRIEQAASTRRQRDGTLASIERHGPNQSFVSQLTETVVEGIRRRVTCHLP